MAIKEYLPQRIIVTAILPHQCPICGVTIGSGDEAALRETDGALLCLTCHNSERKPVA